MKSKKAAVATADLSRAPALGVTPSTEVIKWDRRAAAQKLAEAVG
jgi:hypothetical protein